MNFEGSILRGFAPKRGLAKFEHRVKSLWSLSDDGRTLTMAHREDDLVGQMSVLEKGSQADTTSFG
jgi:hypothetical protein